MSAASSTARPLPWVPILVVTALFTFVTHAPALLALVVLSAAIAVPLAPRLATSAFAQRTTLSIVALVGALGGGDLLVGPQSHVAPTRIWGIVAATAILLATARRFFRDPEGGERPDFGLLATALVACGERRVGPVYAFAVVLFVASIVLVQRQREPELSLSAVEMRAPLAVVAMLAVVALAATAGMMVLPRLARAMQPRFERYVLAKESRVGFADRIETGAPDAMLRSDEIVLRVFGPHVDYLRGRVYDTFDRGAWRSDGEKPIVAVKTILGPVDGPRVTEVRAVTSEPAGRLHYFVPEGVNHVSTRSGTALVDAYGAFSPPPDESQAPVSFEAGPAEHVASLPNERDLAVPEGIRPPFEAVALEWTREAATPRAKLMAIEQHLRHDFAYSLEPDRSRHEPRIVHFLVHSHRGHCEYFATAMALLGRVAGIPTRVVGGFHVTEHNAIGGYDVVRARNAHAWVEGWVDGEGWRTFDPTPVTEEGLQSDHGTPGALADALAATWDAALDRLGQARLWHFGVVLAPAVALLALVRGLRRRRELRKGAQLAHAGSAPLPCFEKLEGALARMGHARSPAEPIERYAGRLRDASLGDVADALLEYGALRYGGVGDEGAIIRRVEACAADLRAAQERAAR